MIAVLQRSPNVSDSGTLQSQDVVECLSDINPFTGVPAVPILHRTFRSKLLLHENVIQNPILHNIERILGESECIANGRTVKKQDYCYDIPLLDTLQCQLRSETIRDQVCGTSYGAVRIK